MATKETIEKYFAAIHKGGWEDYIADDFVFINSNLDNIAYGKKAYVDGAGRFFRVTTSVEIRQMIVEGAKACVLARYQLRSPKGNIGASDVAEILTVKGDKLSSSAIFFDTKAFEDFMAQG
ncbi:nuclear transport factor 2 family protein [Patescibacteria group bacterium]|nr:nuclear transport factor 2 family protein [Patescibacteria group bacterium]MCL5010227.1 nuclear transport factor 2 family protein [Patescibacteria group bacterium]